MPAGSAGVFVRPKIHSGTIAGWATQLLLGQMARGLQPDDPEQWRLYAATMLLSGMVVRNVEG